MTFKRSFWKVLEMDAERGNARKGGMVVAAVYLFEMGTKATEWSHGAGSVAGPGKV